MSGARLAVGIPAYNQPALLRETLTSLCDQGLERHDYVVTVSDDASKANLEEVVAEFRDRLNITYDRSPVNIGHIKNFNRVWQLTDTPYVSFLSHDDVVAPGHFGRVLALLDKHPETVLVPSLALCQRHPGALGTYLHGMFPRGARASYVAPYRFDRDEYMAMTLVSTPMDIVGSVFQRAAFRECHEWHAFPMWHDRLMLGEMGIRGPVMSLPWIAGYYRVGEFQLSHALSSGGPDEFKQVSEVVLRLCASHRIAVTDFWVDQLGEADAGGRIEYLHMLNRALPEAVYLDIKGRAEQRLGVRLHLGGRLDRLGVPKPVANLLRTIDRTVIRRQR
ncbi:MAG TPA: glycosyltransferase family 2 protein [Vicinamibacterales bacterium]